MAWRQIKEHRWSETCGHVTCQVSEGEQLEGVTALLLWALGVFAQPFRLIFRSGPESNAKAEWVCMECEPDRFLT